MRRIHLKTAPIDTVIDLNNLRDTLGLGDRWQPDHIPILLEYLPSETPTAVYGRGPNWLYSALALHAEPEPFYQFDGRLGWIVPPKLKLGSPPADALLQVEQLIGDEYDRLIFNLSNPYLDYTEADELVIPPPPAKREVILAGRLPLWLLTALVRLYRDAPWLGVYQPQLAGAVVVKSGGAAPVVGTIVKTPINFRQKARDHNILIVEDDPGYQNLLETLIDTVKLKGKVQIRTSKAQSLETAKEAISNNRFDLVITSIHLSGHSLEEQEDQSGVDLIREIRAQDALIPIIVVTSHHRLKEIRETIENLGVQSIFEKDDFEITNFVSSIERILESRK